MLSPFDGEDLLRNTMLDLEKMQELSKNESDIDPLKLLIHLNDSITMKMS